MNITCLDVSKTHDVNFGFHFTFTENDNVMFEQDIDGFVFQFEKKADLKLTIADTATVKGGDKTLNVVGQFAEAIPTGVSVTSASVTDGEEKDSVKITGTPTLDSTRKVITFPVALTITDLYTEKTFEALKITVNLSEGEARVSNAFNIIFRAAENPITEQSEEDFTNDRSFALEAYTVDSSKKASSTINATA
ncbi:MAG: hypothetical protein MJ200_02730 [Mycoplasmoidaceae bacterium]|nr:hypothetical protein [Mycoplasmoidaceae bacterium]